jgi:hypothetical protein
LVVSLPKIADKISTQKQKLGLKTHYSGYRVVTKGQYISKRQAIISPLDAKDPKQERAKTQREKGLCCKKNCTKKSL